MTIRSVFIYVLTMLTLSAPVAGQGFAGLGGEADGFAKVVPGREIQFPTDFGPHPEFRIEWWYITANLTSEDGRNFGAQWTLFRQATQLATQPSTQPGPETPAHPEWSSSEFWMGHAALTSAEQHFSAEKIARGGIGQAGAVARPFEAWIDDWRFSQTAGNAGTRTTYQMQAQGSHFRYTLRLEETGPMILHGEAGYSVKSDQGQASYYFSNPFLEVSGTINVDGEQIPVTGNAWLDREWSSQPLASNQTGWDWFSLRFESGEKLMLFGLRSNNLQPFKSGTWIAQDGQSEALSGTSLHIQPLRRTDVAGRTVPVEWSVKIPSKNLSITVKALNDKSWMTTSISYWEGPVTATGSHKAVGYLEMTGY